MTISVACLYAMVPFALIMIVLAARDGAHADDAEYETAIGIDQPRGWLVTLAGIVCLCVIAGIIAGVIGVTP